MAITADDLNTAKRHLGAAARHITQGGVQRMSLADHARLLQQLDELGAFAAAHTELVGRDIKCAGDAHFDAHGTRLTLAHSVAGQLADLLGSARKLLNVHLVTYPCEQAHRTNEPTRDLAAAADAISDAGFYTASTPTSAAAALTRAAEVATATQGWLHALADFLKAWEKPLLKAIHASTRPTRDRTDLAVRQYRRDGDGTVPASLFTDQATHDRAVKQLTRKLLEDLRAATGAAIMSGNFLDGVAENLTPAGAA